MKSAEFRVIPVRHGGVQPTGSWLYVWVDLAGGDVAYVGATGLDPELRAHLHLGREYPQFARVRAFVPDVDDRDFDVLAFRLPDGADRPALKSTLIAALERDEEVGELSASETGGDETIDAIVHAVREYRRTLASHA